MVIPLSQEFFLGWRFGTVMWPWIWCHPSRLGSLGRLIGDLFCNAWNGADWFYGAWCHSANTIQVKPSAKYHNYHIFYMQNIQSPKKETMYNRININIDDPYVIVLTGNNSKTVASLRVFSYGKQWREVAHNCLDAAQLFHDCVQTPSSNSRFWWRTHKFKVF